MELAFLSGSALLGYLYNQKKQENTFKQSNSTPLSSVAQQYQPFNNPQYGNVVGCAASYPSPNYQNQTDPNYINYINQQYQQYRGQGQQQVQNNNNNNNKKEHFTNMPEIGPTQLYEFSNSFMAANDPTSLNLINMDNRSIGDALHNNMVPFSKKFTQNMAGTGVISGNYISGENVDDGFDRSTPYQTKLNMFTGLDETYRHKRESGPMFSPAEQQTNWMLGQSPLFREDLSQYTQTLTKRPDLKPVEPQRVGPGINISPDIPAIGGFHQFTRILPNNVSDYKANQLENRINYGKLLTAGLPESYPGVGGTENKNAPGVVKNRPPKDWSQTRRPVMTSKAGFVNNFEMLRPEYREDFRPKNDQRDQTSTGYGTIQYQQQTNDKPCVDPTQFVGISPARPGQVGSLRSPTFMSQDNNIRSVSDCNSHPIGNPNRPGQMSGPTLTNYYVNETDREAVNPSNVQQLNLKGSEAVFLNTWVDDAKSTLKEDIKAYVPNPQRQDKQGTFWTAVDEPRETMKSTTMKAYIPNPQRSDKEGTFWTPTDQPKQTMKETTMKAYIGDPQKQSQGQKFYTWKDTPKGTVKQSTHTSYTGDANRQGHGQKFYTYRDGVRPTVKQSTLSSYVGDANTGLSTFLQTSRYQYTGHDKEEFTNSTGGIDYNTMKNNPMTQSSLRPRKGGASTYAMRGSTLIENFFPGAGRSNIRQDPDYILGRVAFKNYNEQSNGPGTYLQSLPDGSKQQINRIFASPVPNPNKLIGMDDRQLASYSVSQLKINPLLPGTTTNPDGEIPSFFADSNADNYSDLINGVPDIHTNDNNDFNNPLIPNAGLEVYPDNGTDGETVTNPNMAILTNEYNPLLDQGSSRQNNGRPGFHGHAYSGVFSTTGQNPQKQIETNSLNKDNAPVVYEDNKYVPMQFNDLGMEGGPNKNSEVCDVSASLDFTSPLVIDRDLK